MTGSPPRKTCWTFFSKLPVPDKQYAVIPGAAHAVGMSLTRAGLWHVMHEFLTLPKTAQA